MIDVAAAAVVLRDLPIDAEACCGSARAVKAGGYDNGSWVIQKKEMLQTRGNPKFDTYNCPSLPLRSDSKPQHPNAMVQERKPVDNSVADVQMAALLSALSQLTVALTGTPIQTLKRAKKD